MKETYYLNTNELPTIPVPHDCVIKEIKLEEDCLTFVFEDDISYHDSIKNISPTAKSLIINFHFMNDIYDISLFMRDKPNRISRKAGVFKEIELPEERDVLLNLPKSILEYLYHNVGYCSIIIKLWSSDSIVLDMAVDYVEFEWIE
ncbi:MAG: hypothetical protein ACI4JK_09720 [Oscillospiraceae bacterium]